MTDIRLYVPNGTSENFQQFYSAIPDEKKVKWYRYRISSGDNLLLIAKKFKIPVEAIKTVNRMKNNRIIAGHSLFIPIPVYQAMPQITEPAAIATKVARKPIQSPTGTETRYRVKKGDTLWGIAELFGVKVEEICDWNGFSTGQTIKDNDIIILYKSTTMPQADKRTLVDYRISKGDTPYAIAKKFNMTIDELVDVNELDKAQPALIAGSTVKVYKITETDILTANLNRAVPVDGTLTRYRVQKGDNLFRIAENFDISVAAIQSLNNLTAQSIIKAGDILLLPVQQVSSTSLSQDVLLYEVKQGDNLWSIAVNFGISVQQLYAINNLTPKSVLMPGDVIKVSKAKSL
jgi:membrane-bound lytic murein transglycosylase D